MARWVARLVPTILLTVVMGQQVTLAQDGGGECCVPVGLAAIFDPWPPPFFRADSYQCCCDEPYSGGPCPCTPESGCAPECPPPCVHPPPHDPTESACGDIQGNMIWPGIWYVYIYECGDCPEEPEPDSGIVPCGRDGLPGLRFLNTGEGFGEGTACFGDSGGGNGWAYLHCWEAHSCNMLPPGVPNEGTHQDPVDFELDTDFGCCHCYDIPPPSPAHVCEWAASC